MNTLCLFALICLLVLLQRDTAKCQWIEKGPSGTVGSFAVSGSNLFAGIRFPAPGLFLSTSKGSSWAAIRDGGPRGSVTASPQQLPETVYVWTGGNSSLDVMMASLAGIVNRNTHGELLLSPDNGSLPRPKFWLDQLKIAYPQVQSLSQSSPTFFIDRYRNFLNGYVLYDRAVNSHSINLATSIAGMTNAIIVDSVALSYATAAGLALIADARSLTYSQVYTQYNSQFNKTMLFHQETSRDNDLRDYAIMNVGFTFYTDPTNLSTYVANQNPHGRIYGWGPSEYDLFSQASLNNQQIVASGLSWSSSTTSKWRVPLVTQQYHAPINVATESGKHYVAFVMSDGDNVQWLTRRFATDPKWFGSPYRGSFNMTWDLTSTLVEMNPVAFNYIYQHASNGAFKDNFISAGGAGTVFPSQYPDNAGLVASISQSMKLADQKVISILDPSYDINKLYPILDDPQVMGMMFKTYSDYYKGRDGALDWHNGKPILSVKYSLWDGSDNARSIADSLNANVHRDPVNDPATFSIVNVHPWSTSGPTGSGIGDPMSNLNQLAQWLDTTKVKVVTLEELMVYLRNNFGTPLLVKKIAGEIPGTFALHQNYPNPFNPSTNIEFSVPATLFVSLKVYDMLGREVSTIVNEALTAGTYRGTFYGTGLPSGVYFYRLRAGNFIETKKLILQK